MARAERLSPAGTGPDLSGRGHHGHRLLGVRAQIAHLAHAEAGMTPERVAVVWGSLLTFYGLAMFVSPILVGELRDISGSFIPGLAIAAAASWAFLLTGILLPRNDTHSRAHIPQAPSQLV